MSKRKLLAVYGASRRSVRVYAERDLVRVLWRDPLRRTKSWPDTGAGRAEAKAWAKAFAEHRDRLPTQLAQRITLRGLWERYTEAEFPALRFNTQRLYGEYWRKWEVMWGREFVAEDATREMVDQFRGALERQGYAVSYVGQTIHVAKLVYAWGDGRELLSRNRLQGYRYKIAKDKRVASPEEYRVEEFVRLLAAFDPESATQWRPYVALALCGYQGVRQHAALHLQWADLELDPSLTSGRVTWRAKWDKQGRLWTQPLRAGSLLALAAARRHQERAKYDGPWVLPRGSSKSKDETYSAQSLWAALRGAELRANIGHKQGRGAHGLRRMLAGDVAQATGDAMLGLRAIGDTDMRQAQRYLKDREDRVAQAFGELDRLESVASKSNETATDVDGPDLTGQLQPRGET